MKPRMSSCLLLTLLSCGLDVQEVHYADVAAARSAGAFARGWLPDVLPDDARDISERHDLDTNATWACFSAPTGVGVVRSKLGLLKARRVEWPLTSHPGRPWWPSAMTSPGVEAYEFAEDQGLRVVVGLVPGGTAACLQRTLDSHR